MPENLPPSNMKGIFRYDRLMLGKESKNHCEMEARFERPNNIKDKKVLKKGLKGRSRLPTARER